MPFLQSLFCKWGAHQIGEWRYIRENYNTTCSEERVCIYCHTRLDFSSGLPHEWTEAAFVDNTCDQQRTCKRCQVTMTIQNVHDWEDWKIVKEWKNSCKEERKCKRCHRLEKRTRYTTTCSHEWEYKYVDDEFHSKRCKKCGESYSEKHSITHSGSVYDDSDYCMDCHIRI